MRKVTVFLWLLANTSLLFFRPATAQVVGAESLLLLTEQAFAQEEYNNAQYYLNSYQSALPDTYDRSKVALWNVLIQYEQLISKNEIPEKQFVDIQNLLLSVQDINLTHDPFYQGKKEFFIQTLIASLKQEQFYNFDFTKDVGGLVLEDSAFASRKINYYLSNDMFERAYELAEYVRKKGILKTEVVYFSLLNYLINEEETGAALRINQEAIKSNSYNYELNVLLINLLISQNDLVKADSLLKKAKELFGQRKELVYLEAFIAEMNGEYFQATNTYLELLELDPVNYDANMALGILYYNSGMEYNNRTKDKQEFKHHKQELKDLKELSISTLDTATHFFEEAARIKPNSFGALQLLHTVYTVLEKPKKVEELNEKLQNRY
jgi:hypothetical protein